jgi:uncharacterized protein YjbI with pentapeptide repeats
MRLFNAQPKHTTTFWVASRPRRGGWHATFIVKAAFRLVPDGAARADEEKPPVPSGDDPSGPATAPRYSSDFVPYKPKADFLVAGAAHAPGGGAVKACRVSVAVGGYTKSLAVFGDRRWEWGPLGASPGEPEPFVTMPLGWERAYGGPDSPANPVGRGADYRAGQPLPNIEQIGHLISQSTHRPEPAGFGPLAVTWHPRVGKAGTYDAAWLETRWPWFPADFDWSFFNAAPPDQQFAELRGDETLAFENMHPDRAVYRSRLPGMAARAFVERGQPGEETFEEIPLKLDTVWADVPAEKLVLLWRGIARVASPRLREIAAIYGVLEPLDARDDIETHRAAFVTLRDADRATGDMAAAGGPAVRAEIDKHRKAAQARVEEARTLAGAFRKTAEDTLKATGFAAWRQRAGQNPEDSMAALEQAIAALKERDPVKGGQFAERLQEADRRLGELLAKVPAQSPWTRERVVAALANGEGLTKVRLDGLNLAALDFTGANLSEATLRGATLSDAILDRANLAGADLSKTIVTNASFTGSDLTRANFTEATIANTTFAGARVEEAVFAKLDLTEADFTGAAGSAADFTEAVLDSACFANANLPKGQFSAVSASGAIFTDAILEAADFCGARATGIDLEGADLTNLRASRGADFSGGRFARVRAPRSVWQQAILDRAGFERAVLSQAQFPEASLREANFDRAHVEGANFDDAVLAGATVTNTNLLRASFARADLTNASVQGCNLYGAGLLDAIVEGAILEGNLVVHTLLAR